MRSSVRILDSALFQNRGFRYGALAVSLGLLGVSLWQLHRTRNRIRLLKHIRDLKDQRDLRNAVESLIDEQVCACFEDAGDEAVENAFVESADELRALWGL